MTTYRTPDVYVEEISVFPPSVAEVETAVPAFIGNTEKAMRTTAGDLTLKPTKIYSFKEYEQYFGAAKAEPMTMTVADDGNGSFKATDFKVGGVAPANDVLPSQLLYYAVKMYFDNGGGVCYIVSVGSYAAAIAIGAGGLAPAGILGGLDALSLEDEPTLIVIPEAVLLSLADYTTATQAVLAQCARLGDRFGVFDVRDGGVDLNLPNEADDLTLLEENRTAFGMNNLKYGALYYPFVRTTLPYALSSASGANVTVTYAPAGAARTLDTFETGANANTAVFNFVKTALAERYVVMPPSGAVTGVYAATDTARGVWKAPANVSLSDVIEPVVRLDNAHQDSLNVDATGGKSINAIRAFAGKGTLVWGARTLAGNDNEWRYISVRRFFNMVEESVKKSTYWAVFEPNDANTWVKARGMIENYLTQKWREGALAGATTKEAFFVRCGLGTTMTAQDVLEGRMHVEIGMAAVRPAEFIILKFSHKLQTS